MKYCKLCQQEWVDSFNFCPEDASPLHPSPDSLVGTILNGKYEIVQKLGKGPRGVVYKARHILLGQLRALKLLTEDIELELLARAVSEAMKLRSPNTVRIYDLERADDRYLIVAEHVEGEPLSELLRARGRLGFDRVLAIVEQVAKSLQDAHALRIDHPDLKPEQILVLNPTAPDSPIKVTDYALPRPSSRQGDEDNLASLGMIAYRALLGRLPETKEYSAIERALRAEASAPFAELVARMISGESRPRASEAAAAIASMRAEASRAPAEKPQAPPQPQVNLKTSAEMSPPEKISTARAEKVTVTIDDLYSTLWRKRRRRSWLKSLAWGLLAAFAFVALFYLVFGKSLLERDGSRVPTSEGAAAPRISFSYQAVDGRDLLVKMNDMPLLIFPAGADRQSAAERAQSAAQALERAAEMLSRDPSLEFKHRQDGREMVIYLNGRSQAPLDIVRVSPADVSAYNSRSRHKISLENLSFWWSARLSDYLRVWALGREPRYLNTEEGALLLEVYRIARERAGGKRPGAKELEIALASLREEHRNLIRSSIYQVPVQYAIK